MKSKIFNRAPERVYAFVSKGPGRIFLPLPWALMLVLSAPFAWTEESKTETTHRYAQEGTTYSPTLGWIKTSSAKTNPVTDYYEAEHQKSKAASEVQKSKEITQKAKQAKKAAPKPAKVLVSR